MMQKVKIIVFKLVVYFWYTASPKYINPISYIRILYDIYAHIRVKRIDGGKLYDLIATTAKNSGSTGCEYTDYYVIWKLLNKVTPKNILECGSGVSTIVFGWFAFKQKQRGIPTKVISMESEPSWHEQIKSVYPPELRDYIHFAFSPRVESKYNGILGSHYEEVPDLDYEFMFIDGPGLRKVFKDRSYPKCFNSDLVNLLVQNNHCSVTGLIDQRIDTMRKIKRLIPLGNIKYKVFRKQTVFQSLRNDQLVSDLEIIAH